MSTKRKDLKIANKKKNPLTALTFDEAMGGGGWVGSSRTNVFVNQGGEAYILEPNGNFKFDGLYAPEIHGPLLPRVQAPTNDKINNLKIGTA